MFSGYFIAMFLSADFEGGMELTTIFDVSIILATPHATCMSKIERKAIFVMVFYIIGNVIHYFVMFSTFMSNGTLSTIAAL